MSSKVPTIRLTAWGALIPQLIFMILLIVVWMQFDQKWGIVYGAMTYLIISFLLRTTISRHHRAGIAKVKDENFEMAILDFQKSYQFFSDNVWLDKFRFITILSASKMTFREMALGNIAFCYGQLGDIKKSRAYYERTLKEFPENPLAKTALRFLDAANTQNSAEDPI